MEILRGVIMATALMLAASNAGAEGRITVTGNGSIAAVPDMATITLGVTSEARTAGEALQQNSAATALVLDQIRASGIEPRDMQTSGLSLSPNWNNRASSKGPPKIVGFIARNRITVRVRDVANAGTVLDTVVGAGANEFNGLVFGLQTPEPVLDQARKAAVADAMRKAKLYADAAGVQLGQVLDMHESGGGGGQPPMMMEMARSAVPIAEGEVSIRASVTVVYAIND